jgi:hypothetical protein
MDRKLAAILIADAVGYSKLMEQDEKGAFDRLKAPRNPLDERLPVTIEAFSRSWKVDRHRTVKLLRSRACSATAVVSPSTLSHPE